MIGKINKQMDFNSIAVEKMVDKNYSYRIINAMIKFDKLIEPLESIYSLLMQAV